MLTRIAKPALAYQYLPGIKNVGVFFLPGYNSSMRGPKSKALFDWCKLVKTLVSFKWTKNTIDNYSMK